MNEIEKQLLDIYAEESSIWRMYYKALCKLMNERYVEERLGLYKINEAYLYAGTYMAVQLYNVGKKYVSVKGIVDKAGYLPVEDDVPVLTLDELKNKYKGEKIIITSIRHYIEIKKELEQFIDEKNIIYITELMFGIN